MKLMTLALVAVMIPWGAASALSNPKKAQDLNRISMVACGEIKNKMIKKQCQAKIRRDLNRVKFKGKSVISR